MANRLKLHVLPIFGALEFDNDKLSIFIYGEQIDSSPRFLPVSEFLVNYKRVGRNNFDVFAQKALQVTALVHAGVAEVVSERRLIPFVPNS